MRLDRFNADSGLITSDHRRRIEQLARRIAASWAARRPIRGVHITGHTDSRRAGFYNYRLGLRRARAVRAALFAALERLRPGLTRDVSVAIRSLGPTQPAELPESSDSIMMTYDFETHRESASAADTPMLIYRGAGPPKTTMYLKIPLGTESPAEPMTGVFLPETFSAPERVDVVLYLHGHNDGGTWPRDLTINDYWKAERFPYWNLREGFNTSKFDGILVAPSLGPKSNGGKLTEKDGLSWYLDRVLLGLRAYGPYANTANVQLGNLIVACHSGGGRPMLDLALSRQRYSENIREFWGFDCLYNGCDDASWNAWARLNPDQRLFIDYGNGGTKSLSEQLRAKAKGLANVSITGSTSTNHYWVPNRNWVKRLSAAKSLLQP